MEIRLFSKAMFSLSVQNRRYLLSHTICVMGPWEGIFVLLASLYHFGVIPQNFLFTYNLTAICISFLMLYIRWHMLMCWIALKHLIIVTPFYKADEKFHRVLFCMFTVCNCMLQFFLSLSFYLEHLGWCSFLIQDMKDKNLFLILILPFMWKKYH